MYWNKKKPVEYIHFIWTTLINAVPASHRNKHNQQGRLLGGSQNCENWLLSCSCLPVHASSASPSACKNLTPRGRILMSIFRKSVEKNSSFIKIWKRITCILHEDLCTFMIMSQSVLLTMRKTAENMCRGNQNTHIMFHNVFSPENRAAWGITWKNMVEPDRQQTKIWHGACALRAG